MKILMEISVKWFCFLSKIYQSLIEIQLLIGFL